MSGTVKNSVVLQDRVKTYKYSCFIRNPETKDARNFNIELDVGYQVEFNRETGEIFYKDEAKEVNGYMDFPLMIQKLNDNLDQLPEGYTLISMCVVDVVDNRVSTVLQSDVEGV